MFTILLNKIKSILDANDLIQEVYNHEAPKFNGFPAATISPSSNSAEYSSIANNKRVYAFTIRLFVNRGDRPDGQDDAAMRDLVDSVIDDFDKDYYFVGLEGVPTGYTMINVFAAPSSWGYAGREDEYRVAEVVVQCNVQVDVTAIS